MRENTKDPYAVAVTRDGTVAGNVPRKHSPACTLYLQVQGMIVCTVTGTRRFSDDLPFSHALLGTRTRFTHSFTCSVSFFQRVPHSRTGPSCCRYLSRAIGTQIKVGPATRVKCRNHTTRIKYWRAFNLVDFPENRQTAKLKTLPNFPAYWYMYALPHHACINTLACTYTN